MITEDTLKRHRYWRAVLAERHPDMTNLSLRALEMVRAERRYKDVAKCFSEFTFIDTAVHGTFFAYADMEPETIDVHGSTNEHLVRALISDDDWPIDWGDEEPTDEEREATRAYYVAIQVIDRKTGEEVYSTAVGGIDCVDLEGYLQRWWEDAVWFALAEYLLDDALRFVENESTERAYWAARDVMTVG